MAQSSFPISILLPDSTPETIASHYDWLAPYFVDPGSGNLKSSIQTYIIRTPRHTILVDTGIGNEKCRKGVPLWNMRRGSYLSDLAAAGVIPQEVDFVVCTHLHADHVGWNTRLQGTRWVPTFPNAQYIFAGEEWEFWKKENETGGEKYGCVEDSVLPIVENGQALLVNSDYAIDDRVRLEPSPGHTPGHVCLRVSTGADEIVFSGDVMHRPVQVAEPNWNSSFCVDPARSRATRRAFVEKHANTGSLILAAHFPLPGRIIREGGRCRFEVEQSARNDMWT